VLTTLYEMGLEGRIYGAVDLEHDSVVVLKVWNLSPALGEERSARIEEGIRPLHEPLHPSIAVVTDTFFLILGGQRVLVVVRDLAGTKPLTSILAMKQFDDERIAQILRGTRKLIQELIDKGLAFNELQVTPGQIGVSSDSESLLLLDVGRVRRAQPLDDWMTGAEPIAGKLGRMLITDDCQDQRMAAFAVYLVLGTDRLPYHWKAKDLESSRLSVLQTTLTDLLVHLVSDNREGCERAVTALRERYNEWVVIPAQERLAEHRRGRLTRMPGWTNVPQASRFKTPPRPLSPKTPSEQMEQRRSPHPDPLDTDEDLKSSDPVALGHERLDDRQERGASSYGLDERTPHARASEQVPDMTASSESHQLGVRLRNAQDKEPSSMATVRHENREKRRRREARRMNSKKGQRRAIGWVFVAAMTVVGIAWPLLLQRWQGLERAKELDLRPVRVETQRWLRALKRAPGVERCVRDAAQRDYTIREDVLTVEVILGLGGALVRHVPAEQQSEPDVELGVCLEGAFGRLDSIPKERPGVGVRALLRLEVKD